MTVKKDIISKLKELKPLLRKEYSVKKIGLFGSFASDTFTENSDIDILIELEKPIGWKYFSMELFLEKMLKRKIDLVTKNALKEQLREGILKQVNYL